MIKNWLDGAGIYDRIEYKGRNEEEWARKQEVIIQFTQNNFSFCNKQNFPEIKMVVIMEILHYILRQLIDKGVNLQEDESYNNFKELLLRHSVHRPPHSLAFLTLEDIKKVDLYAQDSFFRNFEMYKYALTYKDELKMTNGETFQHEEPEQ